MKWKHNFKPCIFLKDCTLVEFLQTKIIRDGKESRQASNRIEYYKQFAWYLYVDYENEELGCAKQKQFSAGIKVSFLKEYKMNISF